MKGIRHDVHQLAGKERAVALGRRTVGVRFLDSRLSEAFFGDSGSMMSGGLIQELDRDPLTGFSRHTVTHKINLKQVPVLNLDLFHCTPAPISAARSDIFEHPCLVV